MLTGFCLNVGILRPFNGISVMYIHLSAKSERVCVREGLHRRRYFHEDNLWVFFFQLKKCVKGRGGARIIIYQPHYIISILLHFNEFVRQLKYMGTPLCFSSFFSKETTFGASYFASLGDVALTQWGQQSLSFKS